MGWPQSKDLHPKRLGEDFTWNNTYFLCLSFFRPSPPSLPLFRSPHNPISFPKLVFFTRGQTVICYKVKNVLLIDSNVLRGISRKSMFIILPCSIHDNIMLDRKKNSIP